MGFEPQQNPLGLETVNEFTGRMKSTTKEAKFTICKAQEDMAQYYNQRRSLTLVFKPGDRVYLDASDIKTTCPSPKLSHRRLGPFKVERQVGPSAYHLKLPHGMRLLHPVFNVVKLSATLVMGDQREFDLETRVTTSGNRIISEMFYGCALNK